jgi:hypothetical protein
MNFETAIDGPPPADIQPWMSPVAMERVAAIAANTVVWLIIAKVILLR